MSSLSPWAGAPPLWPQPIPIIGATGKKWSGKSVWGLNICPQPHATLVYDLEQSCTSYEQERARIGAPFVRIDVQREMRKDFPKGDYKPIDVFVWWMRHVRSIEPGQYRVIMVDPVTDLERGLADWVAANPTHFGHSASQYQKMSGIMWGDVKDFEKSILADITVRCETFYFTAHLGAEFKGNTATGREKAKGKETLYELASLYLWFERDPDAAGVRPNIPSARVEKGRLMVSELVDGEVVSYSVLPPRIPQCTPKAIRNYFANPAGKKGLSEGERAREEKMSADERLRLETEKAQAEAATAQAKVEIVRAAREAAAESRHAPPDEDRHAPELWEHNFGCAIEQAQTVDELNELPAQIQAARAAGYIDDEHVARLKAKFIDRRAALQSAASSR